MASLLCLKPPWPDLAAGRTADIRAVDRHNYTVIAATPV